MVLSKEKLPPNPLFVENIKQNLRIFFYLADLVNSSNFMYSFSQPRVPSKFSILLLPQHPSIS